MVTNHLGESLVMSLRNPEESGFLIANVSGLNPPLAAINSTELAGQDGGRFASARVGTRNIVLTIVFQADSNHSIEELRLKSYTYFPIKQRIRLSFTTENREAYIYGYVESNDINIFSPIQAAQISIICPDPFFYATDEAYIPISGIDPRFEFPFSNESTSEPLLVISEFRVGTLKVITYPADKSTGIILRIHFLDTASGITIFNETSGAQMAIDDSFVASFSPGVFIEGDEIIISSMTGAKYALFLRDGASYNILNYLVDDFEWITLSTGDNVLGYMADVSPEHLQITVEYQLIYEGI